MSTVSYLQTMIWCCSSCGFTLEGGQPHMECPICESYKECFIDIPQQVESRIRAEFGDDNANSAEARAARRNILAAEGLTRRFRIKGRYNLPVHDPRPSRKYV